MRASEALTFEPAACWQRLQQSKEFFFEDLDAQMKEHHQKFLEELMLYERQCFINAPPYGRLEQRVDQANGFYHRLVGKVQRRMALCVYGITVSGRRELIDFQIV